MGSVWAAADATTLTWGVFFGDLNYKIIWHFFWKFKKKKKNIENS